MRRLDAEERALAALKDSEAAAQVASLRAEVLEAESALRALGADLPAVDRLYAESRANDAAVARASERAREALARVEDAPEGAAREAAKADAERLLDERARLVAGGAVTQRRAQAAHGRPRRRGHARRRGGAARAPRDRRATCWPHAQTALAQGGRRARDAGCDARLVTTAAYRRRAAVAHATPPHARRACFAGRPDRRAGRRRGVGGAAPGARPRGPRRAGDARVEYQGDGAMTCSLRAMSNQLGLPYDGLQALLRRRLGDAFLERVQREGLDVADIRSVAKLVALDSGRSLDLVEPGAVFSRVARGEDVVVVINYAAGRVGGGGPHAVNLRGGSIKDVGGRTMIEFQDSLVRGEGKSVVMPLTDFVKLLSRSGGLAFGRDPPSPAQRARFEAETADFVRRQGGPESRVASSRRPRRAASARPNRRADAGSSARSAQAR